MKRRFSSVFLLGCICLLTACSVQKMDREKIRDIEFTVCDSQEIPEELSAQIRETREDPFWITYADEGYLYTVRGYGTRGTSGYSVEVTDCYETANAVCVKTGLIGPSKEEEIIPENTYPYVVIKMEYSDKDVVFD